VIQSGESKLLEIVGASHSAGCFPSRLNSRQQQGDQDSNNRDHHQKFNQSKGDQSMSPD
jgi:hypothetical protein